MQVHPDVRLPAIPFARLRCVAIAQRAGRLPGYLGSTLRGALIGQYQQTVCIVAHRNCRVCELRPRCSHPLLFEPPPRSDHPLVRRDIGPPAVILRPPHVSDWTRILPRTVRAGDVLKFEMVLFPPAVRQFPIVLFALYRALLSGLGRERIPFRLVTVQQDMHGRRREIVRRMRWRYPRLRVVRFRCIPRYARVRVRLVTPLRLKSSGRLRRFDGVYPFIASLVRRLSRLGIYYGDGPVRNYRQILDAVASISLEQVHVRWVDWTRYSRRQSTHMQLGGWIGEFVLRGDLAPVWPVLRLGSIFHVGKNTVFGLGQYRLQGMP